MGPALSRLLIVLGLLLHLLYPSVGVSPAFRTIIPELKFKSITDQTTCLVKNLLRAMMLLGLGLSPTKAVLYFSFTWNNSGCLVQISSKAIPV